MAQPRGSGIREPERRTMATLSDLLGIAHFDTSRGSTVERPFLVAVADALGVVDADRLTKYGLLDAVHRLLFAGEALPDRVKSTGATITDDALELLIEGVRRRQEPQAASLRAGLATTGERVALGPVDFDWSRLEDERTRALREAAVRENQFGFRRDVLRHYGARCVVTGTDAPVVLEAAHIRPYKGRHSNDVRNGIPLRVDIHRIWDAGFIAIHEDTGVVLVHDELRSTQYGHLSGVASALVSSARLAAFRSLQLHRIWCGL